MQADTVQKHFAQQAEAYEGLMTRLVPHYIEQNEVITNLIPFGPSQDLHVLDLGSGPGILSECILRRYQKAKVMAFDLTDEMLTACRHRLAKFNTRLTIKQGDFKTDDFGSGYDLILAGLTLHHLIDAEKKKIYKQIFAALNPGGIYLAREIIIDPSPHITQLHYTLWRNFMKSRGEDDGMWYSKHMEKDHPASLRNHFTWLQQAGFSHTACHWQYYNFAVISARKS